MNMSDRYSKDCKGSATNSVLMLLLILAGVGAWNYHRNWQADRQPEEARPYESYAEADLSALREAYATELESVRAEFAHSKRQREEVSRNQGSMTRNLEQFAQTTRNSSAIRKAAANVAERESQIAELDRELELRSRMGHGLAMHLRRLTSF